ncbi:hypothetical protein GIB67_020282 [Kingdonia uniflora]|uniref:Uncharacterized protein n=1 Tax=Kingdonia uniflora TaxID=39325 RepID=A0A7J7P438_9MAGN|nr:hypothetical protein GIB67_020282 [Kingdonia uniflora]
MEVDSVEESEKHEQKSDPPRLHRRIVLFPCPLQGHINPMLQLATLLYSKGFSITIVHTHFNSPNPSNYPLFSFESIFDGNASSSDVSEDVIALISNINIHSVTPLKECLVRLLSKSENHDEPVVCMVSDAIMHFTKGVAESVGLPRIVLRTSSAISYVTFGYVMALQKQGLFPIQESRLEDRLPDFPLLKFKDLPTVNTRDSTVLYELLFNMLQNTKASLGLVWNSFEALEKSALATIANDYGIPLFPVGPFHKIVKASSSSLITQDSSCISWLNTQSPNSVIYVSFGSIVGMDRTGFVEIAWGLANSGHPFLWVVRPDSVPDCYDLLQLLPDGFLEIVKGRSCIVQWAPQQDVLAHPAVGGFWTHNGWNSTLESICEGVPMLCTPSFGDQKVNARFVNEVCSVTKFSKKLRIFFGEIKAFFMECGARSKSMVGIYKIMQVWRVGLHLENWLERRDIESSINRLMEGEERKEMIARVKDLKEETELCLRKGGSSYESLQSLTDLILSF